MSAPHHYVHHNYPPNAHQHSTLFPSAADGGLEGAENELLSDDPLGNTINIVGLLVALLVSVIIIVGVAFVIRKIRKRQGPANDEHEEGVDQGTKGVSGGTFPEIVTVHPGADAVQGDEQTPQVFTITFTAVPKKQKMYIRALPKFLRPKPKQVDIEKIKRELGHVYVY